MHNKKLISELIKRKIGINYPGYKVPFCSYDTWLYLREKELIKIPYQSGDNPEFINKILQAIDSELERIRSI